MDRLDIFIKASLQKFSENIASRVTLNTTPYVNNEKISNTKSIAEIASPEKQTLSLKKMIEECKKTDGYFTPNNIQYIFR